MGKPTPKLTAKISCNFYNYLLQLFSLYYNIIYFLTDGDSMFKYSIKSITWSLTLMSILTMSAAAHEVWVETGHMHGGDTLQATLGYGDFPKTAPIPQDRLHIFKKPLQLVGTDGVQNLVPKTGASNIEFQSQAPLNEGSYLVLAEYSPTFWSENKDGWRQVNLTQMPDAKYCEMTQMFGKNVVNVGHFAVGKEVVSRPVGQKLEIVPLDNPANALVGEPFPMKVLFNGEPLAGATVLATFEGFAPEAKVHKLEPQAFSDTTLADGTVNLYPLRQGFWKVRVVHKSEYPDQKVCQKLASYATLSFDIGSTHH